MQAIFVWALGWLVRGVVIKSIVLGGVVGLVSFIVPFALSFLTPFISSSALTSAFSRIPPGVWWFIDMFNISTGVPLLIAAFVARFLIRRLPVIG